jgi:hypothetical protein
MQTKTGIMLVEDRDLAYLFLDPTGIPEANHGHEVTIAIEDDVTDWENEEEAVWLEKEGSHGTLRVMKREIFWKDGERTDFDKDGFPIPTPVIIADKAAWKRHREE